MPFNYCAHRVEQFVLRAIEVNTKLDFSCQYLEYCWLIKYHLFIQRLKWTPWWYHLPQASPQLSGACCMLSVLEVLLAHQAPPFYCLWFKSFGKCLFLFFQHWVLGISLSVALLVALPKQQNIYWHRTGRNKALFGWLFTVKDKRICSWFGESVYKWENGFEHLSRSILLKISTVPHHRLVWVEMNWNYFNPEEKPPVFK